MDEIPNEGSKQGLWSIFCATWPVAPQEPSSNLLPRPTRVSLCGWAARCQAHGLCERHNKD